MTTTTHCSLNLLYDSDNLHVFLMKTFIPTTSPIMFNYIPNMSDKIRRRQTHAYMAHGIQAIKYIFHRGRVGRGKMPMWGKRPMPLNTVIA